MTMLLIAAGIRPEFSITICCGALVVPISWDGHCTLVGKIVTIDPTLSPVGDFEITNSWGLLYALLLMVTVPDVFLASAPSRIKVHPVAGARLDPQFPPCVKLAEGAIALIVRGTLLTLRKASTGLTRGERLNCGMLLGNILAMKSVLKVF